MTLAEDGAAVVALPEDPAVRERKPDATVDDRVTEFKSLRPGAPDATVTNQLLNARGQAPNVVIDARDSGLSEQAALLRIARFNGSQWRRGGFDSIQILGDDSGSARNGEVMMSADDDVFIAGGQSASEVRRVIEAALGGRFAPSTDPDPVPALAAGPTQVFFHDGHPFEDDIGLPLTRYQIPGQSP